MRLEQEGLVIHERVGQDNLPAGISSALRSRVQMSSANG